MPAIELKSEGGVASTYRWTSGTIQWEGEPMTAFIIGAIPLQGGLDRSAYIVNRILAEESDSAAGLWGAFARYPEGTAPVWKVLGLGKGTQARRVPADCFSADLTCQLEALWPMDGRTTFV